MGGFPAEEDEPSPDQLAALAHRIKNKQPPYADLGIFGPHGDRIQRRLQFMGLVSQADGSLARVQINGPPSYEAWDQGFRVLETTMIMLSIASPSSCAAYRDNIRRLHLKFGGPTTWSLLYQADVRARREQMI
eukprot:6460626-Amphidinium_carterae.1